MTDAVILDTNVFVAAGFSDSSASAAIVSRADAGELALVWSDATRQETERILRRIPPLDEGRFAGLFRDENRYPDELDASRCSFVSGAMDRQFLALAEATGVPLVTNDSDLLDVRDRARVPVLTPTEFLQRLGD